MKTLIYRWFISRKALAEGFQASIVTRFCRSGHHLIRLRWVYFAQSYWSEFDGIRRSTGTVW